MGRADACTFMCAFVVTSLEGEFDVPVVLSFLVHACNVIQEGILVQENHFTELQRPSAVPSEAQRRHTPKAKGSGRTKTCTVIKGK